MELTVEEQSMLAGDSGHAAQTAMRILAGLGRIYGAARMIPVHSAQIAGVSYDNLGEAGLEWLSEMADGGGRTRIPTTLNPAGMDLENWRTLGIPEGFAASQIQVIDAFTRMGAAPTCTCTPYLAGNAPSLGESIAWAESSAVCYANSVLGARTNREGGPSALASALTGRTAEYGMHLAENRRPGVAVEIRALLTGTADFGALGKAIGERVEALGGKPIPWIAGVESASIEELKSFCASLATYGGLAMFHMQGITPEAADYPTPSHRISITEENLQTARASLTDANGDADFVSLGCPHLTLGEVARIAELLRGKHVTKEFWITTSRAVKLASDRQGLTKIIETSGAKFAVDTCCVVAPIRGRFHLLATDSAKACYYARAKNQFHTQLMDFDLAVESSLTKRTEGNSQRTNVTPPAPAGPPVGPGRPDRGEESRSSQKKNAMNDSQDRDLRKSPPSIGPEIFLGRPIAPGIAEADALVSAENISFFGGVEPESGTMAESGHELEGQNISGKILVFPAGKGSTVGSYTLYRLAKAGKAPAAILNAECEPIVAVGCILAGIPCVDHVPVDRIATGDRVRVDGTSGRVEIQR